MLNWEDAKAAAEALGGHLATVTSVTEHEELIKAITKEAAVKYQPYLGAFEDEERNIWHWVTGEAFEYERLSDQFVDEEPYDETYLRLGGFLNWQDYFDDVVLGHRV